MFSQNNDSSKIDFRNYSKKPARRIPFELPEEIKKRTDHLMKTIGLNSGSIDMILTPDNEFYFLEVNPVGQFGMTSIPCNYKLEEIIASKLITEDGKPRKRTF